MEGSVQGTLNVEDRTYTTITGAVLNLRPVSSVVVQNMRADNYGKPQPPSVTSFIGPKKKPVTEVNADDPEYKQRLTAWQEEKNLRMTKYVVVKGVENRPSREDKDRLREYFPGADDSVLKFNWVLEALGSDDELGRFVEILIGQTTPTAGGVADSEATFPSDRERLPDTRLPVPAEPGQD